MTLLDYPDLRYLRYVTLHKQLVYKKGRELGVPRWRLLSHDWHKFTPLEWGAYVYEFEIKPYLQDKPGLQAALGYFHTPERDAKFSYAWLRHQHMGPHHWQYWVLKFDDGGWVCLRMPEVYVREMLADWWAAGETQMRLGKIQENNPIKWYLKNQDRIHLHPETRRLVHNLLIRHFYVEGTDISELLRVS